MQCPKAQEEMTLMLMQCFQSLKLYGKEPEQFEGVVAMFRMVLGDYPIDKIKDAFAFYLKRNSEMPAPADIANIIERGNKPPFERSLYVSLSKKDAAYRSRDEWAYMRDYERYLITGRAV
jgi:hypothetical protein